MSRRNIDKQVYEQYVDATVALFMEHYTAVLTDTILEKKSASVSCSETLDRRCMEAIRKESAKQRHREIWQGTKKVLRSAAVILVALLSLSSILFMTVEAFRVPVINFFIEQGDGFWVISGKSEDNSVNSDFDPNDPLAGLLPEGYEVTATEGDTRNVKRYYYQNYNDEKITLWFLENIVDMTVDSEDASKSEKCYVAHYEGILVTKDGFVQLAWFDQLSQKSYLLSSNTLDGDALLRIAEQMMKKTTK